MVITLDEAFLSFMPTLVKNLDYRFRYRPGSRSARWKSFHRVDTEVAKCQTTVQANSSIFI